MPSFLISNSPSTPSKETGKLKEHNESMRLTAMLSPREAIARGNLPAASRRVLQRIRVR